MKIIGIDPGFRGGWAYLEDGELKLFGENPTTRLNKAGRLEIDLREQYRLWKPLEVDLFAVELVGPLANASRLASFSFGRNAADASAYARMMGYRIEYILPTTWKKEVLAGTDRSKQATLAWARRRWPKYEIPNHDGIGDALAISEFAWRKFK